MKTFITPENKYVVEINGYNDCNDNFYYFIGDIKLNNGYFSFDEKPKVYSREINKIISYYTNVAGDKMLVEDYNNQVNQLLSKKIVDSDGWNSLEDEFNYKKFFQTWTAIFRDEIVDTELDLKWVSHKKPNSKYIQTSYYIGKDYYGSYAILFEQLLVSDLVSSILEKKGFKSKEVGIGDKQPKKTFKKYNFDNEVSIHLNSGYFKWKYGRYSCRGTLSEIESTVKQITEEITRELEALLNGEETVLNGAEIITKLKEISNELGKINIHQKSQKDYSFILNNLRNLITEIEVSLANSA